MCVFFYPSDIETHAHTYNVVYRRINYTDYSSRWSYVCFPLEKQSATMPGECVRIMVVAYSYLGS